jgi:hypothetical protein
MSDVHDVPEYQGIFRIVDGTVLVLLLLLLPLKIIT